MDGARLENSKRSGGLESRQGRPGGRGLPPPGALRPAVLGAGARVLEARVLGARVRGALVLGALALSIPLPGCPTPAAPVCTHEGAGLGLGERVAAADGCNECTCLSSGRMDCTIRTCASDDGGVLGDAAGEMPGDSGMPPRDDGGVADAGLDGGTRPPSACLDLDDDGYYSCIDENYPERPAQQDCDDARWFVQPGGYDFPGNGIDDDCDGEVDEGPTCTCSPDGNGASASDALAAMDLCDDTVLSVSATGDARQFGVYERYYERLGARSGACLSVLSTGVAGDAELQSGEFNHVGNCGHSDPLSPGTDDEICDLAQLRLELQAPPNARGIEFAFMFLSSEWPEWLCYEYNDTFYTLLTSAAVQDGARSNISFDAEQRQITVNVGFFEQPRDWTVPLDDTPLGGVDSAASCPVFPSDDSCLLPAYCDQGLDLSFVGSGSGWLQTQAPIEPGEERIELVFSIHDEGDGNYDSAVLLDGLRWVPYRPPLATTKN